MAVVWEKARTFVVVIDYDTVRRPVLGEASSRASRSLSARARERRRRALTRRLAFGLGLPEAGLLAEVGRPGNRPLATPENRLPGR
jgi:hypothetical protein